MKNKNNKSVVIAIIAMMFLFAMISFVTNMAAPFGTIWKFQYSWAGMMGNMMNFAAYLFMGIPAGKMLLKHGYKKTLLIALATGFIGIVIQWISSRAFLGASAIYVYLLGAFICGFCVCMLNTVVNPMLNLLGGGGNKGNQYIQIGGSMNSLAGTFTPLLVGVLIGTVTEQTSMSDVTPLLFIAMGVFALAYIIISLVNIPEPAAERKTVKYEHSAWSFRHLVLGVVAIFFYVGVEVDIPSQLIFYFSDATEKGAGIAVNGVAIGGAIAAVYWLLMMVGRIFSSFISGKVSTKAQLVTVSSVAILFVVIAIFLPKEITMTMPAYSVEDGFTMVSGIPVKALFLVLCGLCTSLMWGGIFNLSTEGLGKYTEQASGIFMMMVVGGGVMPLLQDVIAKNAGYMASYWLVIAMLCFILYYAVSGCKNV